MNLTPKPGRNVNGWSIVSRAGGIISALFGVLALTGWVTGRTLLASVRVQFVPMAPSTALFFIICGILLSFYSDWTKHKQGYRTAAGLMFAMTAASLLLLILSLLRINLILEHLGMPIDGSINGVPIGHMSPLTAVCFILIGTTFLLVFSSPYFARLRRLIYFLPPLLVLSSLILLILYLAGGPVFYRTSMIPPAVTTVLAFLAAGLSLTASMVQYARQINHDLVRFLNSVSYKLIGLVVLILIFVVLAANLFFRSYAGVFRESAGTDLMAVANLKVHEILQWRLERLSDGRFLTANPQLAGDARTYFEDPGNPERLRNIRTWLSDIQSAYQYQDVYLIDIEAESTLALFSLPMNNELLIDQAREVIRQNKPKFIDFYRQSPDGPVLLSLLVPLKGDAEPAPPQAVLALQIDPYQFLYPLIMQWPGSSSTAETLIVRRDGAEVQFLNVLRFNDSPPLQIRFPLSNTSIPAVMAVLGHEGIVEGTDYRNARVLAAILPIPDSPWFLVARKDSAEVYTPLRKQLYMIFEIIGALIIAIIGMGAALWQRKSSFYFRQLYQSQKAREENEERYKTTIQNIREAIITTDSHGLIQMMNPPAEKLTGWNSLQAIGKPFEDIFRIIDETTREAIALVGDDPLFHSPAGRSNHTLLISRQGDEIPVSYNVTSISESSGPVLGTILVFRDHTQERESERELEFRSDLLANVGEAVVVRDSAGKIIYWNRGAESTFGWTEADAVGRDSAQLLMTDQNQNYMQESDARSLVGRQLPEELLFRHRSGMEIVTLTTDTPLFDDAGVPQAVISVSRDITARKELEIRYSGLFNSIWDAILIANTDREIIDCNSAFSDLFGYNLDEIRGQQTHYVYSSMDEFEQMGQELKKHMNDSTFKIIIHYKKRDGSIFRGETSASVLYDNQNKVLGFIGLIRDVTEREMIEQQLIESQKMESLGQVAGGIAHDFNNVLMAINGATQILRKLDLDTSTLQLVETIISSAKRGNAVTNRMLTFTRSTAPETKAVALGTFLAEFREMARYTLPQNIHLRINLSDEGQQVLADPVQLQQVFLTLAINAADAMGEGGYIDITVRRPGLQETRVYQAESVEPEEYWCLDISDEGCGMEESVRTRVFEPFFTTKDSTRGTGLGLAVVYKIVNLHRGWIEVASTPGRGTTFTIGLPAITATTAVEEPENRESFEQGAGESILIIDDEETIRELLSSVLTDSGYQTATAENAGKALSLLETESASISLIITDIGLPDMNGKNLIVKIRELYPAIPIMAMTGYVDPTLEESLLSAGAEIVMKKPYDLSEMSRSIRKLLK